jgi:hypothetical protein
MPSRTNEGIHPEMLSRWTGLGHFVHGLLMWSMPILAHLRSQCHEAIDEDFVQRPSKQLVERGHFPLPASGEDFARMSVTLVMLVRGVEDFHF